MIRSQRFDGADNDYDNELQQEFENRSSQVGTKPHRTADDHWPPARQSSRSLPAQTQGMGGRMTSKPDLSSASNSKCEFVRGRLEAWSRP